MTALRPAIARGVFLASRLRLREARNAVDALEMVGLPAGALTLFGRISAANDAFQALIPRLIQDHGDRARLTCPRADARLHEALLKQHSTGRSGGITIPVAGQVGEPPYTIHLVPVERQAHDVFSSLAWLLLIIPVENRPGVPLEVLRGLFDLTPAEARVSRGILEGDAPSDIARKSKLSPETVRSQLKTAFAKMGVKRQTELVRLLTGVLSLNSE